MLTLLSAVLQVMDKHMGLLCKQHLETKFVKVRARIILLPQWEPSVPSLP
jgi:hypothetical protein